MTESSRRTRASIAPTASMSFLKKLFRTALTEMSFQTLAMALLKSYRTHSSEIFNLAPFKGKGK